jgi:S-adenosylmethionine:tRNA ribosyltransferase-isomerase
MKADEFRYQLPDESIAQSAVEPRDSARILDTRDMSDHRFTDLAGLLREGDLVVVNNTKVRRARLVGTKQGSGGRVELLILNALPNGYWRALVSPARRIRPMTILEFSGLTATVVAGPTDGIVEVDFDSDDVEAAFQSTGEVPLPPYFHGSLTDDDRYQTVFARDPGSAAAPTAGLHFTDRVIASLASKAIGVAELELHVGIDTFRPIIADELEDHEMHREWCSISEAVAQRIIATRRNGGRIVAIGTTTVRTLETFARPDGTVSWGSVETDLFLRPGSRFQVTDLMVTNFHVPGSTLIAMVAGFMGKRWRDVYQVAIERGYRFLSFGDAMLLERST